MVKIERRERTDLPLRPSMRFHGLTAQRRLLYAAVVGVIIGVFSYVADWHFLAVLLGWDGTALFYIANVWLSIRRLNAEATAEMAVLEDPTRGLSDTLLIVASLVSIVAIGLVMANASRAVGVTQLAPIALALVSLVISWTTIHIIFTLHYARLYYTGQDGGIEFNQVQPPRYSDFAYVSFTIGMTFQVSDTNLTSSRIRATALRQALLSYIFGAIILASTINLVSGLGK